MLQIFKEPILQILFNLTYEELDILSMLVKNSKSYEKLKQQNKIEESSAMSKVTPFVLVPTNALNSHYVTGDYRMTQGKDTFFICLQKDGWSIHLAISKYEIELVRSASCDVFLDTNGYKYGNFTRLLLREANFRFAPKVVEELDDSDILAQALEEPVETPTSENHETPTSKIPEAIKTTKPVLQISHKPMRVLGKGVVIYVIQRPT